MVQNMLNEEYFGKNPLLTDCDKQFDKIKNMLLVKNNGSIYTNKDKDVEECVRNIENNIKELFNFKFVVIELVSMGEANAFTYTKYYDFNEIIAESSNKLKKGKFGVKYDDKSKTYVHVVIGGELMTKGDFTGAEMTSVLLHEIGHNLFVHEREMSVFYRLAIFMSIYTNAMDTSGPLDAMGTFIPKNKIRALAVKAIQSNKTLNKIKVNIDNFDGIVKTTMSTISSVIYTIMAPLMLPFQLVASALSSINLGTISGYRNEKFADNFATTYGYGPEIVSIEKKFINYKTTDELALNDIYIFIKDIMTATNNFVALLGDPHPHALTRAKDQIKYIEYNIKKIKDPKLQALLKEDLALCEKEFNKLENNSKTLKGDKKILSAYYFEILASLGGDIREKMPLYKSNYNHKTFQVKK